MDSTGAAAPTTPAAPGREGLRSNPKPPPRRNRSKSARADSLHATAPALTFRRPYSAYTKRDGEAENAPKYDDERTNREWWRYYIKETPIPGAYQIGGFMDDLHKTRYSYRFRDTPRAKSASHQRFVGTGEMLIPGRYDMDDFIQDASKKPVTYGFKAIEREQGPKIGHGCLDKELTTSPVQYNVVDYRGEAGQRGSKTYHFKSHVPRDLRLAHQFRVVPGPGPGMYESSAGKGGPAISSSFKSKVSRFQSSHTRVPGPGTYSHSDSAFGMPKPVPAAAVMHMKKKHGISVA